MTEPKKTPNARHQSDFRQRHKDEGRTEVRGIYAEPADHPPIKEAATKIIKRSKRKRKENTE